MLNFKIKFFSVIAVIVTVGTLVPVFMGTTEETEPPLQEFTYIPLSSETLSKFPRPTLPPVNVVDSSLELDEIKEKFPFASEMPDTLPSGEHYMYGTYSLKYDEIILYYGDDTVKNRVTNDHNIPEIVTHGAIVFDYERLDNLSSKMERIIASDEYNILTNNSEGDLVFMHHSDKHVHIIYEDDGIMLTIIKENTTPQEFSLFIENWGI